MDKQDKKNALNLELRGLEREINDLMIERNALLNRFRDDDKVIVDKIMQLKSECKILERRLIEVCR